MNGEVILAKIMCIIVWQLCHRWQSCKKLCYSSSFIKVHLKCLGSWSALDVVTRVWVGDQENWSVEQWDHDLSAPFGMLSTLASLCHFSGILVTLNMHILIESGVNGVEMHIIPAI